MNVRDYNIVMVVYDEKGREIGYIADNYVAYSKREISDIMNELADICGEALYEGEHS